MENRREHLGSLIADLVIKEYEGITKSIYRAGGTVWIHFDDGKSLRVTVENLDR